MPNKSLMRALVPFLLALLSAVTTAAEGELQVTGYARETLPGSQMSAAYLTLHNAGAVPRQLRRIQLPGRDRASADLHTTVEEQGVSRMRPLPQLTVPPGGEVRMAPGGVHLMLHGLHIAAGAELALRLHFADGAVVDVKIPVRRPQGAAQHAHH